MEWSSLDSDIQPSTPTMVDEVSLHGINDKDVTMSRLTAILSERRDAFVKLGQQASLYLSSGKYANLIAVWYQISGPIENIEELELLMQSDPFLEDMEWADEDIIYTNTYSKNAYFYKDVVGYLFSSRFGVGERHRVVRDKLALRLGTYPSSSCLADPLGKEVSTLAERVLTMEDSLERAIDDIRNGFEKPLLTTSPKVQSGTHVRHLSQFQIKIYGHVSDVCLRAVQRIMTEHGATVGDWTYEEHYNWLYRCKHAPLSFDIECSAALRCDLMKYLQSVQSGLHALYLYGWRPNGGTSKPVLSISREQLQKGSKNKAIVRRRIF